MSLQCFFSVTNILFVTREYFLMVQNICLNYENIFFTLHKKCFCRMLWIYFETRTIVLQWHEPILLNYMDIYMLSTFFIYIWNIYFIHVWPLFEYINNIFTMILVNVYLRTLQLNWCLYIIEVRHLKLDSTWFLHSQLFMVDLTSENNYSSWAVMVVCDPARRWSTVGSSAASLPSSTSTARHDFLLACTIECHCFYHGIQHLQLWLKWEFWSW